MAVVGMLVAGCGGGATAPTEPASALDGLTAQQVLAKSRRAVQGASSGRLRGSMTENRETTDLDLLVSRNGRGQARLTSRLGTVEIRATRKLIYLRGDGRFWRKSAGAAAAGVLKGRWVRAPRATFGDEFPLLELEGFRDLLVPTGRLTRVPGVTLSGRPTVGLKDHDPKKGGVLYVADKEKPYPLLLVLDSGGRLEFTDWNSKVTVRLPAKSKNLGG